MNSYNITDVEKLKLLFEQAFSSCSDDQSQTDYDEYIALVAEGRADLLPASVRSSVLDRISFDPDSAELLKSLEGISAVSQSSAKKGGFRVMSITWAMAATVMFGLFMWRVIVPPPVEYSFKHLSPFSTTSPESEYWNQAHKQRLVMDADSCRLRDYALIGSIAATCLLSVIVLSDRLKGKKDT
jgi:hypothetical protein